MKTYKLGVCRELEVSKYGRDYNIVIRDTESGSEAVFHKARWTRFLANFEDIDEAVDELQEKLRRFHWVLSYGGGWKVQLIAGNPCVDLRRFTADGSKIMATKHGIALYLSEWKALRAVIPRVIEDYPDLNNTDGCQHEDHDEFLRCRECFPFSRPSRTLLGELGHVSAM